MWSIADDGEKTQMAVDGAVTRPTRRLHRVAALLGVALVVGGSAVGPANAGAERPTAKTTLTATANRTVAKPTKSTTTTAITSTTTTSTTTTPPPTSTARDGTLRRAALRLTIASTSDWVNVDLPGPVAGHVVVANPQGREVAPTGTGLTVRGPLGAQGTVTVDVVAEIDRASTAVTIGMVQGGAGASTATIENITGVPYLVGELRTDWSATSRSVELTADRLMGSRQLEWKRADPVRQVLAFTYPWFGSWATTDARLTVHPLRPWLDQQAEDTLRITHEARAHGIDGFVMSFAGGADHGLPLHNTLQAAASTGGTATVLIETTQAGGSAAVVEKWIGEALAQAGSPAFLRAGGVPVVFAFETGWIDGAGWKAMSDRFATAGTPVRIIADTWHGQDGGVAGQYRYNAMLETATDELTESELTAWNQTVSRGLRARATLGSGKPGIVVATVQPGWDDRNLRGDDRLAVPWNGTATYDRTWRAAVAGEADWVVITSWNEAYEGTNIEPSAEHGDAALRATATWAARFKG